MKITDVDIIPAHVPLAARNAEHAVRFRSIDQRTFFKVQTDNGLVGWGEYRCTPPNAIPLTRRGRTTVKITDIDIIPAHVPLAARNAEHAVRFRSIDQRTFFKVQTDNGLVGWGEYRHAAVRRAWRASSAAAPSTFWAAMSTSA